ncbi:MAG: PQQ-binding-like beta-propeller repeat protein [bacterium]
MKNISLAKKNNIFIQALSLSSLILFFLMGIILLNIDLKRIYQLKSEMITICEQSASKGAFYLLEGIPMVNLIVNHFIKKSGFEIDNILIKTEDLKIEILLTKKIRLISGVIFGFSHQKINTRAVAYHQPMQKIWEFDTRSHIHSSPVIQEDILYCGVASGFMYALDITTGRRLWSFDTSSGILYDKNGVAVEYENYKLNRGGCCIQSNPIISNNCLYFTVLNAENNPQRFTYLYRLDTMTGSPQWLSPTLISDGYGREDYIWCNSSPVIFKDTCYVGSVEGKLYAINIDSGKIIDNYSTSGSIISSPLIKDEIIYFGSNDGKLRALKILRSGKLELKWAYPWTGSLEPIRCKPTIFANKVYFTAGKYYIYAVDIQSEELSWAYDTSEINISHFDILSSPVIQVTFNGEKLIHFGTGEGVAICLKEDNNEVELKWRRNLGVKIESSPVISDGIIYYGVKSGQDKGCLFALSSLDGTILQKYYIKNNLRSTPTIHNQTLYFGGCDSCIQAIKME